MEINQITQPVLKCAFDVHSALLGPGLLESAYEECLFYELIESGLSDWQISKLCVPLCNSVVRQHEN